MKEVDCNKRMWLARLKYLLLSMLFLATGLFCYARYNPHAFFMQFMPRKNTDFNTNQVQSVFLASYAADICWSMSMTIAIQAILLLKKTKIWYLLFLAVVGFVYESLQMIGLIPGTGDVLDYFAYLAGSLAGVSLILLFERKNQG